MHTSTVLDLPPQLRGTHTINRCYAFFGALNICGIDDLSEGQYDGDPTMPFARAQRNQHNYLLDQVWCWGSGSRLLEIGCGNGTLLLVAGERGARGVGLTLAEEQRIRCRRLGLDVRLLDWRDVPDEWEAGFDSIVANGSLEHFVQPEAAAMGMSNAMYRHFFETCHRLLQPNCSARLVTAAIHYGRYVGDPVTMQKNPWSLLWGSDAFHMALLARVFGGSYPSEGQLERCADGLFTLVEAQDGTEDYRLTSEWGLKRVRRCFLHPPTALKLWAHLLPRLRRDFRQGLMWLALLFTESWQWQFRGPRPPMQHWRHTWQRID